MRPGARRRKDRLRRDGSRGLRHGVRWARPLANRGGFAVITGHGYRPCSPAQPTGSLRMTETPRRADPLSPERPPLERLIAIMARLRDPARGCPWDVEQSFATIAPYTIEEAYEVADAIQQGDMGALKDELGDLLLQVVFHARMAEEAGSFGIEDVARAINDKMIKRHPHVFADAVVKGAEAQTQAW